jgi:hypothetical protein
MCDRIDVMLVIRMDSQSLSRWGLVITEQALVGLDPQVDSLHVPIEVGRQECLVVAQLTREPRLALHMDHLWVSFQIARVIGFIIALITMKTFDSLMYSFLMVTQKVFVDSLVVTEVTGELLALFVGRVEMSLQIALVSKLFCARFAII